MIRPKTTVDMKLAGTVVHHARIDIAVRDLTMIVDEPAARGGTNAGITPTETMVSALVGCTNVISQRIAHRDGVHFGAMTINAHAKFDRRGAALEEEIETPFTTIALEIDVATDATEAQMEVIKTDLARFCPIAKVLRAAGTVIEETWNVRPL
ncbi:MAG: OsmC family protein [Gemmobacter sp.]|nr:OsmC family protein [Gemmobacter sp.]